MNELKQYLLSNKVTRERLLAETHDTENRLLPQRNLFVKLKQYAKGFLDRGDEPRLIALSGLRGVGKTTLMWQTAKYIFDKKTKEIFFINVDDLNRLGYRLYDTFSVFENEILRKPFHEIEKPIVFLIDEVHESKGWDKDLKILYERCKRSFIFCTGSSALLLHQSPDLASRWSLIKLYPFSFTEFILAKSWLIDPKNQIFAQSGLGSNLKQVFFYSNDIENLRNGLEAHSGSIKEYLQKVEKIFKKNTIIQLINEYISYHNIARFLTIQNKSLINDRIIDLFERILIKDIPAFTTTDSNDTELMFRLLLRLSLSDEVSYDKLAGSLGCKKDQIEIFIETLHKAEILNLISPYGGVKTKTGIQKKTFFMSPSLRRALYQRVYGEKLEKSLRAKLYEDIVAMYLRRVLQEPGLLSFGMEQNSVSPDFIVETCDSPVIIEIGSKKQSVKQTEKYQQKKRYGVVVDASAKDYTVKGNSVIIPLSWFLLL